MYLDKEEQKVYNKAVKYADRLYKEAKTERDTKGYRECLGYDKRNKLQDKINELKLENYQACCDVLNYYERLCDSL